MSKYLPDRWVVVKIINALDVVHKVFGCWYGGYMGSDSWQMNSGITAVTEANNYWLFEGVSGSVYKCMKGYYGVHSYGRTILSNFVVKAREEGVEIVELPENTDWKDLNYYG